MGKNRLSSLALLYIHYDTPVDLDQVVDIYAKLHPRRLELASLLCDWAYIIINTENTILLYHIVFN